MTTSSLTTGLGDALFTKTQQSVLGLLFGHSERSFYLNEIVRIAAVGVGTVQRELRRLEESGLVTVRRLGNQKHYQANHNAPIFSELRGMVMKTFGFADVLRLALTSLAEQIEVALVFGSMASGKATEGSDIDLLVIGDVEFAELVRVLHPTQELLGREINPIYNREEWRKAKQESSAFIRELMDRPVINVIGGKDDLG